MRRALAGPVLILSVLLGAGALPALAAEPSEPAPAAAPSVEQLAEQVRLARAAAHEPSSPPQVWGILMMQEVMLLNAQAQQAAGGGPVDEAALHAAQQAMRERVFAEWKAARPDDPTPYLAEMQEAVPADEMDSAVLALLPRFPDNPILLARVLPILQKRGESTAAMALVDGALERHPDRAELYGTAAGFYRQLGSSTRRPRISKPG